MNDADMLTASATVPIIIVPIAPPKGVIISREDDSFVAFPNPRTERAKIVGNMIASKA